MEDKREEKRYSVDTTKEVIEEKKRAAKGKGITFRPYIEDMRTRLAMVEEKRAKIFYLIPILYSGVFVVTIVLWRWGGSNRVPRVTFFA